MSSRAHACQTGIHHRIVELQPAAVALPRGQPQVLEDLQPDGAGLHRGLEIGHRLVGPARRVGPLPIHVGEHAEAIRVLARLDVVGLLADRLGTAAATQVDEHAHVHGIEFADEAFDRVRRRAGVTVDVDDRELRLRHQVLLGDQRRSRPVVEDAGRRELRLLAPADADLRRAGRTLAAGVGWLRGEPRQPRGWATTPSVTATMARAMTPNEGRANAGHGVHCTPRPRSGRRACQRRRPARRWRRVRLSVRMLAPDGASACRTTGLRFGVCSRRRATARAPIATPSCGDAGRARARGGAFAAGSGTHPTAPFLDTPAAGHRSRSSRPQSPRT